MIAPNYTISNYFQIPQLFQNKETRSAFVVCKIIHTDSHNPPKKNLNKPTRRSNLAWIWHRKPYAFLCGDSGISGRWYEAFARGSCCNTCRSEIRLSKQELTLLLLLLLWWCWYYIIIMMVVVHGARLAGAHSRTERELLNWRECNQPDSESVAWW